jgi:hypothetical protein
MSILPPRVRPRRGAWRGSRQAKATAAACLAAIATALAAPGPAAAYRCTDPPPTVAPASGLTSEDCQVPVRPARTERVKKRGSVSTLTVFVLAVGAILLVPIGRGIPHSGDPYGHDRFL